MKKTFNSEHCGVLTLPPSGETQQQRLDFASCTTGLIKNDIFITSVSKLSEPHRRWGEIGDGGAMID